MSAEQEAEIPSQTQRPLDVGQAADAVVLADYSPPGVVVNAALEIVQFRGHTEPYLRHVPGKASLGLLEMAPEEIAVHLGAAVGDARRSGEPTVRSDVAFHAGGRDELLTLHVVPLPTMGGELHFVVLFESRPAVATKGRTAKATHPQLEETRRELSATRDYLQTVIEDKETANEELRASNEEVQSANEELQSINEELETAKEELQSTNEELVTVNDELRVATSSWAPSPTISRTFSKARTSPSSCSVATCACAASRRRCERSSGWQPAPSISPFSNSICPSICPTWRR